MIYVHKRIWYLLSEHCITLSTIAQTERRIPSTTVLMLYESYSCDWERRRKMGDSVRGGVGRCERSEEGIAFERDNGN